MEQLSLFEQIKKLSDDYYDHRITFEDYRNLRNALLKKLEARYNGAN